MADAAMRRESAIDLLLLACLLRGTVCVKLAKRMEEVADAKNGLG